MEPFIRSPAASPKSPPPRMAKAGSGHGASWRRTLPVSASNWTTFRPRELSLRLSRRTCFSVDTDGFFIEIKLICRHYRRMPAGIGIHPYFPKPAGTRFASRLPAFGRPTLQSCRSWLRPARRWARFPRWAGCLGDRARPLLRGLGRHRGAMLPSGHRTRIEARGVIAKLQIRCLELSLYLHRPVSNANDGFNRMARGVPGHGVHILEPGQSLSGRMTISRPELREGPPVRERSPLLGQIAGSRFCPARLHWPIRREDVAMFKRSIAALACVQQLGPDRHLPEPRSFCARTKRDHLRFGRARHGRGRQSQYRRRDSPARPALRHGPQLRHDQHDRARSRRRSARLARCHRDDGRQQECSGFQGWHRMTYACAPDCEATMQIGDRADSSTAWASRSAPGPRPPPAEPRLPPNRLMAG